MGGGSDGNRATKRMARLGKAFSYDDLDFEMKTYEGIPVRVATARMLFDMKKDTLRLQDRADAEALKQRFNWGD